jgi:integrase
MADEWANSRNTHVPSLMPLSIADVDTARIVKALRPLWVSQHKLAERLRYRIECIWNFAKSSGLVSGDCPARYKTHLANLLPSVERVTAKVHHDSLGYEWINALMRQLEAKPGDVVACLRYTILTAARSGEARGLRWDEVDFETRTITIPASRMKANVAHMIPMADRVIDLLTAQQAKRKPGDELVFNGRTKGEGPNESALVHVLRRLRYQTETIHGLRTTFRTWCAEQTNHASEQRKWH